MLKSLTVLAFISTVLIGQAQVAPNIEWQRSLGGSNLDAASSIQRTSDGGYILAGVTQSNNGDVSGNHGENDFWVVKLDADGVIQWQKALGGSDFDLARSVQQTTDGGYVVTGSSPSSDGDVTGGHGGTDVWVVKLDPDGMVDWQETYGGTDDDGGSAIQQTSDGGYIIAGNSRSNDGDVTGNHGGPDAWVLKLDVGGTLQWQKCLGGTGYDATYSVQQTSDGGYILAGETGSNDGDVSGNHGGDGIDCWIVKLDGSGNLQWQKTLGGSGNDVAASIRQTDDGGYIMAASSPSTDGDVSGNHGATDFWTVKLDTVGNVQWQQSLGGSLSDFASDIHQLADGGYIVAGITQSQDGDVTANNGSRDVWVVRLNAQGTLLWQKTMGGSSNDSGSAIALTDQGGYVVGGYTDSNDGDVTGNHGGRDCWVVKLGPDPLGIPELENTASFSLFPNPSSDAVNIQLDLATSATVRLQLYDATGQLVGIPVDTKIPAGGRTFRYSTEGLSTGTYEMRLNAGGGGKTFTRKLIKQ
jgi:hypothetical protein